MIGEENRGWYVGTTTLDFERSGIATSISHSLMVQDLATFVRENRDEGWISKSRSVKHEIADRMIEAGVEEMLSYQVISMQNRGLVPNKESSIAKLYSSELDMRIAGTAMRVLGPLRTAWRRQSSRSGERARARACISTQRRAPSAAGRAKSSGTSSPLAGWGCRGRRHVNKPPAGHGNGRRNQMDFRDNTEEAAFREEVRDFIKTEVKSNDQMEDLERGMYRGAFERLRDLRGKLSTRGWIAPAWPKEYGGAGLDVMRQFIMNEEFAENRVPPVGGMGVSMVGPTLITHG